MSDHHPEEYEVNRTQPAQEPLQPFEANYEPMGNNQNLFWVVDAVLKRPSQVLHEIMHGKTAITTLTLLAISTLCLTGIGLMMAGYSGGAQFGAVPLKIVIGTLLGAAICLPSLYILLCLSGGTQTFPQVCSVLFQCLALTGILFIGFLPVAWIFSQATDSIQFMGVLYLLIWGIGIYFGLRLLRQSFVFLNKRSMGTLRIWGFIFVMVLLQMSTTLRPLLGTYEPLRMNEKKFFVAHWFDIDAHADLPASRPGIQ